MRHLPFAALLALAPAGACLDATHGARSAAEADADATSETTPAPDAAHATDTASAPSPDTTAPPTSPPLVDCDLDAEGLCADGDPCTLDGCDPLTGCTHTPIGEGLCDPSCCVALTPADLAGPWLAHLDVESEPLVSFIATFEHDEGHLTLDIAEVVPAEGATLRLDLTAFSDQIPYLTVTEGRVAFLLTLPWVNGPLEREPVLLFPQTGSRFSGAFGPLFHTEAADAAPPPPPETPGAEDTLPWGMLRLEREIPFSP